MNAIRPCSIEGCPGGEQIRRGLCRAHYQRLMRSGELTILPCIAPSERLAAGLVQMPNGCLEWTGVAHKRGYGRITINSKSVQTHRLAWELANGPIPDGMFICHTCDNPPCCNPDHLWPGTNAENTADKVTKGRAPSHGKSKATHCPHGHPFTQANIRTSNWGRKCWICTSAATARRRRLVECLDCGRMITASNLSRHSKKVHSRRLSEGLG